MTIKHYFLLLGLLLAALLPSGCEKRKAAKPHLGEVERLPHVDTIVLGEPALLAVVHSYAATVEALEKADLCSGVKGYVKNLPADLDIGKTAKQGELLFSIDVPDLVADRDNKKALLAQSEQAEKLAIQAIASAQAEVKESQALLSRYAGDVDFHQAQYARISKLVQGDTLSRQQADEAKLQLDAARSALAAAQAQVVVKQNLLQAAHLKRELAAASVKVARTEEAKAEVQVQLADVRAPFDGVITKRWVDRGATIKDAGVPLFTFMRRDRVRVILDVPERDSPYFHAQPQGNAVRLFMPAMKETAGTDKISGTITRLSGALDPVTRTMRVEMELENKVGGKVGVLKPQMTGAASVTLAVRDALTVPSSALIRTGDKSSIFIVASPVGEPVRGIVKRVEVATGLDDGQRVEIKSDALTGRELVIVRGAGVLRSGDEVIAVPAKLTE